MLRRPFGNSAAAIVVDPVTGRVARRARVTVWDAERDGNQVTDLCDLLDQPLPDGIVTADDDGLVAFLGPPDGRDVLWLDAGVGAGRIMLRSADVHQRAAGVTATAVRAKGQANDVLGTAASLLNSRGAPSGLATLGFNGLLPAGQVPPLPPGVLDALSDVDVPAPQRGQALLFDGTRWTPGAPPVPVPPQPLGAGQPPLINKLGEYGIFPGGTLAEVRWSAEAGIPVRAEVSLTADGVLVLGPPVPELAAKDNEALYRNALARKIRRPGDATNDFGFWETDYPPLGVPTVDQVLTVCAGRIPVILSCTIDETYDSRRNPTSAGFERLQRIVNALIRLVKARDMAGSVLIWPALMTFNDVVSTDATLALLQTVVDAGLQGVYGTVRAGWVDPLRLVRLGVQWIAIYTWEYNETPAKLAADVRDLAAAGLKVMVGYPTTHTERDLVLLAGPQAIITEQPLYLSAPARYRRKADPFASQTRSPGMIPSDLPNRRNRYAAPNWWVPGYTGGGSFFTLQGWGCPMDVGTSWAMTFDVRWDAAMDSDSSGFLVAFCCPTDDPWWASTGDYGYNSGYTAELLFNGGLILAKYAGRSRTASTAATAAPTAGQIISYRINVTPTTVTLTRVGSSTVTLTDAAWRGRYFHMGLIRGASDLGVSVRNVVYS